MDTGSESASFLEVLLFLFATGIAIYIRIIFIFRPYGNRLVPGYLYLRKLESRYKPSLERYFPFYNALSDKKKRHFEKRVQKFIDIKQFIPRGGIGQVTPEMKAMIAATAIQLTFGYPRVYFRHFRKILIYPDNYYSTITRMYHKGEVNVRGIIVLSWKSFHEGFVNPTDGMNLGLHEMAHALRLINIVSNDEYNFYDRRIMDAFDREAVIEMEKMKSGSEGSSIFRNYSVTNKEEFFAVAVEFFFERSCIFREYNQKLYSALVRIFRIDPEPICRAARYGRTA